MQPVASSDAPFFEPYFPRGHFILSIPRGQKNPESNRRSSVIWPPDHGVFLKKCLSSCNRIVTYGTTSGISEFGQAGYPEELGGKPGGLGGKPECKNERPEGPKHNGV